MKLDSSVISNKTILFSIEKINFPKQTVFCFFIVLIIIIAHLNLYSKTIPKHSNSSLPLNRISGFVYDQNRNPVPRVFVELQDELNRSLSTIRTETSGRYIFAGMSSGTFYVRVITSGTNFIEQTAKVQIVNLGPPGQNLGRSDSVKQDFYLRPRKSVLDSNHLQNSVIYAQEIPINAKNAYRKAVSQINNKNYTKGIKLLQKAIKIYPKYFFALNRLGFVYFEQKKYELASQYFAQAADVNPKSEPTIYLLAYSVYLTKRYDATLSILKSALKIKHTTSRIYLLYGKCLREKRNFEEAEKKLKLAETLNIKKDPEVHWELAKLYGDNLNRFGDAATQLELFLKLQPDSKDKKQIRKLIKKFKNKAKTN